VILKQLTPNSVPSKDGASHEALAVGARLYHECAVAADEKFCGAFGVQLSALYPVLDNLCHSIELSLKAYLKSKGVPFKRRNTHSIKILYKCCEETAAAMREDFPSIEAELLEVLNDMNVNKVLRYGERPERLRRPLFIPLDELAETLFNRISAPKISELRLTE
jgi:hypothetical protein